MTSPDSAKVGADFIALGQQLLQHGWRLLNDCSQFTAAVQQALARAGEDEHDAVLEQLKARFDALLEDAAKDPLRQLLEHLAAGQPQFQALFTSAGFGAEGIDAALGAARLGPLQHHQERLHRYGKALQECAQAQQAYLAQLNALAEHLLSVCRLVLEQGSPGEPPTPLQGRLLEAVERGYEEFTGRADYVRSLGRLTNAHTAVTRHVRDSLGEVLGWLGLPTREELSGVQRQLHELRRHQRGIDEAATHEELTALRRELAQLRREVAELRQAGEAQPETLRKHGGDLPS